MDNYIMNEYSFEYRVFDEYGADAGNNFKIFPEWCYQGAKPTLKLAVLIKQWNKFYMSNPEAVRGGARSLRPADNLPLARHSSAVINHFSGAVDFTKTERGRVIACEAKEYNDAGGKLLLPLLPEEFSGIGKIFFPNAENPDYIFYYTVNMFKKCVLGYTCKTSDNSVTFKFDSSPAWDIGLKLMQAEAGCAPCLVNRDVTGNRQVLKSGSKMVEFTGVVTANRRFRVTFENSDDSQFYLLSDKSVAPSGGRMVNDNARTLRCPFCLRPIAITKESQKCQKAGKLAGCTGEQIDISLREEKGRGRVCCCANSASLPDRNDPNGGYIHTKLRRGVPLLEGTTNDVLQRDRQILDNILLPKNYERGDSIITTVIGGAQSGKSVFISRLAGVERNNNEKLVDSVSCSSTFAQSAMYGFFDGVDFYYPETVNESQTGHSVDGWINIFNKLDYDNPEHGKMIDYVMPLYGEVARRTDASSLEILQRMPFIIKLDSDSNMTFFDVPGEPLHIENARAGQVPSVKFSDGLILLVNVDSSEAHNNSVTDNSNNVIVASRLLNRIISELNVEESSNGSVDLVDDITDHMLAIVLCKLDMFDDKFDINSAVLSSDLCDGKGKYRGSAMQKNTDAASEEVERLIMETPGSGDLLQTVKRFKYRKFFAVSSLGTSDCIESVGGKAKFMFTVSPKRMEHILQWLLWQAGIIE